METRFNLLLVVLSVLVAVFASYVALNLGHSVTRAHGRARALWLATGAVAMGVGIWSMHFIGMLAFEMPGMAMAYDIPLMVLSVVVAIAASALALFMVSRHVLTTVSLIAGGVAMAAAIAGMHYIGMASMRMPARIEWNLAWVAFSIAIALASSFGALMFLTRLRNKPNHFRLLAVASGLMGFGIAGMHYTGMIAARFVHDSTEGIASEDLLVTSGLTSTVVWATILILGLALGSSLGDRAWRRREKIVHETLDQSEERFRRLVDAVKEYAIFMLDPNGRITTWNVGAERITGYPESEIVGRHLSILYPEGGNARESIEAELSAAIASGQYEGEGQRRRKDGSLYWTNIVIAPLYDAEGRLSGFSKVTRDITERKETERRMIRLNEELEERVLARTRALARREAQLRTIANAAPVLIAQFDAKERVLFANETFCRWFHHTTQSIAGHSLREILKDDRYSETEAHVRRVLTGEPVTYERESSSGAVRAYLSVTVVPDHDSSGEVAGFIVVASDITKQKEIQSELERAKEAAEVANAAKSSFLANMSHEIRTPLGAVLGFSELLLDGDMTAAERQDSVEVIKRNGRLLSNIINDILDLSKVEAGKLEIEMLDVGFGEIMKEIGSLLSLEAAGKGIELRVTTEGPMPPQIRTDPLRLRQILLNIVGNAIKFTKKGYVHVTVKMLEGKPGKLAFIVQDTGEGIAPEQIAKLFTPFTQADASTTRKFGGTGLGLVLSRRLAEALGGDVVLTESAVGRGSTFMVTIDPGLAEEVRLGGRRGFSGETASARRGMGVDLGKMKILVADDSPDNQALVGKILQLSGAEIDTAGNGNEAVEMAMRGDYSLILMDLQMPGMDGYEATRILREKGFRKPIIALTAHAMKEERQRALRSGFDDHLTKPIDHSVLVKTIAGYTD